MESFNFSTTAERLKKIDKLNSFNSKSDFINSALDYYIEHIETKYLSDFIYYIGFPFISFIGLFGLSLYFINWFLYFCTVIVGIYLCILGFLFMRKYSRRRKH